MGRPKGPAAVLQTAPAYTFGGRCGVPSLQDKVPGPGTYQPRLSSSNFLSSRGTGFGTSGRLASYGEPLSDPRSNHNLVVAQAFAVCAPRQLHSTERGPLSSFPTCHSMLLSGFPATHRLKMHPHHTLKACLGKRLLTASHPCICRHAGNKNPGPSEYDPRERVTRSASPSYTFHGVAAKNHLIKNPAPGQYNPDRATETMSAHATAPAITMSHRLSPPKSHSRQPAPGEYETYKPYLAMCKGLPVSIKFR